MRRTIAVAVCLSALIGAQGDAVKEDLKKLQGAWNVVSILVHAKDEKLSTDTTWTIADKKLTYSAAANDYDEIIAIDPTKGPRTIAFKSFRKGKEEKPFKAIYKFEDDRLVICVDVTGKVYPQSFESKAESDFRVITLQRVKK